MMRTLERKVCSSSRKVGVEGKVEDVGVEATSYVRRVEGNLRMSNAKPKRWNALLRKGLLARAVWRLRK